DGCHRATHPDRLLLGRGPSSRSRGLAPASGRASSTPHRPPLSLRLRRLNARLINFVEERQLGRSLLQGLGAAVLPHDAEVSGTGAKREEPCNTEKRPYGHQATTV